MTNSTVLKYVNKFITIAYVSPIKYSKYVHVVVKARHMLLLFVDLNYNKIALSREIVYPQTQVRIKYHQNVDPQQKLTRWFQAQEVTTWMIIYEKLNNSVLFAAQFDTI